MKILKWIKEKLELYNNKKILTNLLILLCIGIIMVISANFFNDFSKKNKGGYDAGLEIKDADTQGDSNIAKRNYEEDLENQLSYILSKIGNAGKVSVMITYKGSKELIIDKDKTSNNKVTNEKDNDGGTRVIDELDTSEKTVFVNEQGNISKIVITKEINPEIKGVIIVAEGAKDAKVKSKLSNAVQTALDIPAYRVLVLEAK